MTSQRAKKLAEDALRAPEREGECAGKSIIEMVRAELIRECIRYLRNKGNPNDDELIEHHENMAQQRGVIIGLSKAVLIYELPYKRGSEAERKKVVARALKKARELEERMAKRRTEAAKPRDFRVTDSGDLQADLAEIADKQVQDLNDMLNGEGRHEGHKRKQVGRCVYCECGVRAQGRLKK